MCWKQEWAHAIYNLEKAVLHIQRAHKKFYERRERNKTALKNSHEKPVIMERIRKNTAGLEQCEGIIIDLKKRQDQLFIMIHEYGISHSDDPKRVYKLMGKYPYAEKLKEYRIRE